MKRLTRILTMTAAGLVLVGGYAGWQVYQGQQMALHYTEQAQASASNSFTGKTPDAGAAKGQASAALASGATLGDSTAPASPSAADTVSSAGGGTSSAGGSPSPNGSPAAGAPDSDPASSGSSGSSGSPASSGSLSPSQTDSSSPADYKALMGDTYQKSLQTMENVKINTLTLKSMKLSLSAYKSTILQAKSNFASALAFAQAHPPADPALKAPYQEFVAGITLAYQSMNVVLNGVSGLNASDFYAAREMGKTARDKVVAAYGSF